jgi:hypothetical protein
MANEGIEYYFGIPPLFVKLRSNECVEKAVTALLTEDTGRWLEVYGTLQEGATRTAAKDDSAHRQKG